MKANVKDTRIIVTGERPSPPARERTVNRRGERAARTADNSRAAGNSDAELALRLWENRH